MGAIKKWWKERRGRVRQVARRVGLGLVAGAGLSVLPWWGTLLGGVALGASDRVPAIVRMGAGLVSPLAGVGASVPRAIRERRPLLPLAAGSAYYLGRWGARRLVRGKPAVAAFTVGGAWKAGLLQGVWF